MKVYHSKKEKSNMIPAVFVMYWPNRIKLLKFCESTRVINNVISEIKMHTKITCYTVSPKCMAPEPNIRSWNDISIKPFRLKYLGWTFWFWIFSTFSVQGNLYLKISTERWFSIMRLYTICFKLYCFITFLFHPP